MSGHRDVAKDFVAQIEAFAKELKAKLETDNEEFISLANDLATTNLKFAFIIGELYAHESSGRHGPKKAAILTPWDRTSLKQVLPTEEVSVSKKKSDKTTADATKKTKPKAAPKPPKKAAKKSAKKTSTK